MAEKHTPAQKEAMMQRHELAQIEDFSSFYRFLDANFKYIDRYQGVLSRMPREYQLNVHNLRAMGRELYIAAEYGFDSLDHFLGSSLSPEKLFNPRNTLAVGKYLANITLQSTRQKMAYLDHDVGLISRREELLGGNPVPHPNILEKLWAGFVRPKAGIVDIGDEGEALLPQNLGYPVRASYFRKLPLLLPDIEFITMMDQLPEREILLTMNYNSFQQEVSPILDTLFGTGTGRYDINHRAIFTPEVFQVEL